MRNLPAVVFILLFALSAGAQAQCGALASQPAPSPGSPLQGSQNYWFVSQSTVESGCTVLHSPSVKITVKSEMKADSSGFDFQFNVDAAASAQYPNGVNAGGGPGLVGWQQYIINVRSGPNNTTDVWADINNWPTIPPAGPCTQNYPPGKNCDKGSDLTNTQKLDTQYHLVTIKDTPIPALPKGTVLTITLNTDPKHGHAVTGVTFNVTAPSDKTTVIPSFTYYNGKEISLKGLHVDTTLCAGNPPDSRYCPAGLTTIDDTAPVTAVTLNIASDPVMPEGSGTLEYISSDGIMVPVSGGPQNCATGYLTGESSFYTYGSMQACTTEPPVQPFGPPCTMTGCAGTNWQYYLTCMGPDAGIQYNGGCRNKAGNTESCRAGFDGSSTAEASWGGSVETGALGTGNPSFCATFNNKQVCNVFNVPSLPACPPPESSGSGGPPQCGPGEKWCTRYYPPSCRPASECELVNKQP